MQRRAILDHLAKHEAAQEQYIRKRVASLLPSPENECLYKPVTADDPEIKKLADSITKNGCEPLVITEDDYIVSGHRRRMALKINGQKWVKCRVLPQRREDMSRDDHIVLLREFNHQRHKTAAEQVREELLDIDPDEAYFNLKVARSKSIDAAWHNGTKPLHIEGTKKRHGISDDKADHVKWIKQVVFQDRRAYWPLSVRSVHYALLNHKFMRNISQKLPYKNDDDSYGRTSDLITRLRLNNELPWRAFDDPTRPLKEFHAFKDVKQFVRQEIKNLFGGYWRDVLQSQPNHVEVVCEKNTIYHMVLQVTQRYQIPTSSGRGFNSIDPWHDLFERYQSSDKEGLIVIVMSDYDPEGEMIPQVGGRTLRDDFGVGELTIIKAGVTREQIEKYKLPAQNFAKESSSNHQWFVNRNDGKDAVYELEALEPENMLADLETEIKKVIDVDLFNREAAIEQDEEAPYLEATRKTVHDVLKGVGE